VSGPVSQVSAKSWRDLSYVGWKSTAILPARIGYRKLRARSSYETVLSRRWMYPTPSEARLPSAVSSFKSVHWNHWPDVRQPSEVRNTSGDRSHVSRHASGKRVMR